MNGTVGTSTQDNEGQDGALGAAYDKLAVEEQAKRQELFATWTHILTKVLEQQ